MSPAPRTRTRTGSARPGSTDAAPPNDPVQTEAGLIERIARRLLGPIRPGHLREIDGVRYRERHARPIQGLLPRTADGLREFEVVFPGMPRQRPMRIRATRSRIYDDLTPDPRAALVRHLDTIMRPGDRALLLGAGTGASAGYLGYLVGPSGGVVALDRDGESVRFARQRYTADQIGFEMGWLETLSGELDEAFDAVIAVDPVRDADSQIERARTIAELLRVRRSDGVLMCMGSSGEAWEHARRAVEEHGLQAGPEPIRVGDWRASIYYTTDRRDPAPSMGDA